MSDSKMVEIANKLLEQSKENKVDWSEISGFENRFFIAYPDYSIRITFLPSDSYKLSVHNENGTELESLLANERSETGKTLKEIFEIAKRKVLRSEEVLDKVLARLSGGT